MSLEFRLRDLFRPPLRILLEVGVAPGQTVLDFGCGPGAFSVAAARIVGPGGNVYAVDVNPLALAAVRRAAKKRQLTNMATLLSTDLGSLPNATVDVAILYDVLHGLPDPPKVLAELHRLAKPGGLLTVSDHHMSEADIVATVGSNGLFAFSRSGSIHAGVHCFRRAAYA
jgi:ubiquinone/menaquinone biosynthesis C-methylase UbiE